MKKKIVFCGGGTGGHIIPALSLLNYFEKNEFNIFLVTDKRGQRFLNKDFNFFKILNVTSPFQKGLKNKFFSIIKLIFSFISSFKILFKEKPDIVFGLGGYLSFPFCLAARIIGIKVLIYEQNLILGRTNKILSIFCKKIFLNSDKIINFDEKYRKKSVVIGNLIREEIKKHYFNKEKNLSDTKTIIILGGSQGALIFTDIIPKAIYKLKEKNYKIKIIQQAMLEHVDQLKNFYRQCNIDNYIFSFDKNILELISKSDLAISRCGASTLGELAYLNVPFIGIPYPYAVNNHQHENALFYQKEGLCNLLKQKDLNSESLSDLLIKMLNNNLNFEKNNFFKNQSDKALFNIKEEIEKIFNENSNSK